MSTPRGRNLQTLFKRMPAFAASAIPNVRIRGVSMDSRTVRPGWLFAAIKGESANGYDFIPQALANGAAAVMGTLPAPVGLNAPYLQVAGDIHARHFIDNLVDLRDHNSLAEVGGFGNNRSIFGVKAGVEIAVFIRFKGGD